MFREKTKDGTTRLTGNPLLGAFPVGSLYFNSLNVNPGTFLGGTWVAHAVGQTIIGVDPNDTDFNAAGKTGGEKSHVLTAGEMPGHVHGAGTLATSNIGNHAHGLSNLAVQANTTTGGSANRYTTGGGTAGTSSTDSAGQHAHDVSGSTANAGSGNAHNNLPPYITTYIFRRTA